MKKIIDILKWIGIVLGALFVYRKFKGKSSNDINDKFEKALQKNNKKREKIKKEWKDEKDRIKNMDTNSRIGFIKFKLRNYK